MLQDQPWLRTLSAARPTKVDAELEATGGMVELHACCLAAPATAPGTLYCSLVGGQAFALVRPSPQVPHCPVRALLPAGAILSCKGGDLIVTGVLKRGLDEAFSGDEASPEPPAKAAKATKAAKAAPPAQPARRAEHSSPLLAARAVAPADKAPAAAAHPGKAPAPAAAKATGQKAPAPAAAKAAEPKAPAPPAAKATEQKAPAPAAAKAAEPKAPAPPAAKSTEQKAPAPPAAKAVEPKAPAPPVAKAPAPKAAAAAAKAPVAGAPAAEPPSKKKKERAEVPISTKVYPTGLRCEVLRLGSGQPAMPGRKVQVRYEGRLAENGQIFDKGDIQFRLGLGEVIRGWDDGIKGMLRGEKKRLHVPSKLAYGAAGAPPDIPSNADLVFDVDLLSS